MTERRGQQLHTLATSASFHGPHEYPSPPGPVLGFVPPSQYEKPIGGGLFTAMTFAICAHDGSGRRSRHGNGICNLCTR
jgi:hypothetical protein